MIREFGRYDAMFERLLGEDLDYETFEIYDGVYPDDPETSSGVVMPRTTLRAPS